MPVVTGGWTIDAGTVEWLDRSGHATILFYNSLLEAIKKKLAVLEAAGTLSTAEISLRGAIQNINPLSPNQFAQQSEIERILHLVRQDPKYTSKGLYMPFADVVSCIENQWTNILKKWG